MTENINSSVSITSVGFGRNMRAYPMRMEWNGRTYQFIDHGIQVISRRGEHICSIVTVSDGEQNFCLRESDNHWTLLSVC